MKKSFLIIAVLITVLSSCKTRQPSTIETRALPEVEVSPEPEEYRAAVTRTHDLVHTILDVRFDWKKKHLLGKARITLMPHFYPSDQVWLDARGMDIRAVKLLRGADSIPLQYTYANDSIDIRLDRTYKGGEKYELYIDYTAKPDELKTVGGSNAISSDKGLYFINADGSDPKKPMQIWTQGETQSNSVWFPTIDVPNQKMTQELRITVEDRFKTLSNGLMVSSVKNTDGTRTDTWKQDLPHAPYLVMMAIGEYSIVKDTWRGKEVSYYVEPKYEGVARKIFGNTPEMLEFFSTRLGVDYPWSKYSQVVVRDYVSGAMENTSATIHGEFVQRDLRELLDEDNEDVIAHELFHHWFGDLVTCESWSNLPLNESFATYGEYLWNEYKYGREEADLQRIGDLSAYLREAKTKQVDLIRFSYEDREDMFDRHSYQKGGLILHMLRKWVGDEAFFASLKEYLSTHKFQPVEVHDLRLAFEKVTGQDLNWFFNQWFLASGHPDIDIRYDWDETTRKSRVIITQKREAKSETPLFRLPLEVDVYSEASVRRIRFIAEGEVDTLEIDAGRKPVLVNVDAEKSLLCVKNDMHNTAEWMAMYRRAPLYQDRQEAITALSKSSDYKPGSEVAGLMMEALNDRNWRIRSLAISYSAKLASSDVHKVQLKEKLIRIARSDSSAGLREDAVLALADNFRADNDLVAFYQERVNDSSFAVMSAALLSLGSRDRDKALALAAGLEKESHEEINGMVADLYARYGSDTQARWMNLAFNNSNGFNTYRLVQLYARFLQSCKEEANIVMGLESIRTKSKTTEPWWVRMSMVQGMVQVSNYCNEQAKSASKAGDANTEAQWKRIHEKAVALVDDMKKTETNENLLRMYNAGSK